MDGRFYSRENLVYRNALETKDPATGRSRITMGFRVLEVDENVADHWNVARKVAELLNAAQERGEI